MTPRTILFTFQSCADLNEIWEAIAMPRSPWSAYDSARLVAAERFAERFEKLVELLPKHPEIGVARDDLHAGLSSVPLGRYAIYYRTRGDCVEVLRVLRAAPDSGFAQSG